MKKVADFFVFVTAALVIPATIKDYFKSFYDKYAWCVLIGSVIIGALISILNSANVKKSNGFIFKLKYKVFSPKNIAIFLFSLVIIALIFSITFPFFHFGVPNKALLYLTAISIVYTIFLLISDQIPFSHAPHLVLHYDGRHLKADDLLASPGGIYDHTLKKEIPPYSSGNLKIVDNEWAIERTNIAGRYKLTLQNYIYKNTTLSAIPVDALISGARNFNISCEARSAQGVRHVLVFAFADATNHGWYQSSAAEIISTDWQTIEFSLFASAESKLKLRIDDIEVARPSTIIIRNLKVTEKT